MPNQGNAKYVVNYATGTTLTTRRNGMTGDGPLVCPADSWAAKVLFADAPLTAGGGRQGNMRLLGYVIEGAFEPLADLLATHLAWWVTPERYARFLSDLDSEHVIRR